MYYKALHAVSVPGAIREKSQLRLMFGVMSTASPQFGNFNSRSIAWKRGSLRSGSKKGLTFVYAR